MLRISFDFNETTKTVSNVKVVESESGRGRGIATSSIPNSDVTGPDLEVLDNKLQLSKSALAKLEAKADDRISIQYISEGVGKSAPVIGKAQAFTDARDGNRLAAKGTVAFRGEKRSTLVEFGTLFNLEEYKDGIWKLIPIQSSEETDDLKEETADMEALNSSELDKEIEEINSFDDLPF